VERQGSRCRDASSADLSERWLSIVLGKLKLLRNYTLFHTEC